MEEDCTPKVSRRYIPPSRRYTVTRFATANGPQGSRRPRPAVVAVSKRVTPPLTLCPRPATALHTRPRPASFAVAVAVAVAVANRVTPPATLSRRVCAAPRPRPPALAAAMVGGPAAAAGRHGRRGGSAARGGAPSAARRGDAPADTGSRAWAARGGRGGLHKRQSPRRAGAWLAAGAVVPALTATTAAVVVARLAASVAGPCARVCGGGGAGGVGGGIGVALFLPRWVGRPAWSAGGRVAAAASVVVARRLALRPPTRCVRRHVGRVVDVVDTGGGGSGGGTASVACGGGVSRCCVGSGRQRLSPLRGQSLRRTACLSCWPASVCRRVVRVGWLVA